MSADGDRFYFNRFYSSGGWQYSLEQQRQFLVEKIIEPVGLTPGSRLLEIGCGMGMQSGLLFDLGFDVTGVDVSDVAIQHAKRNFPGPQFLCMNLEDAEFARESFDVIYSRGLTWYHYNLDGVNPNGTDVPHQTRILFDKLKKGGVFILQISTDFSGTEDPATGVINNKLDHYVSFFERFGEVIHVSNWNGVHLDSQELAECLGRNIIIATRKRSI